MEFREIIAKAYFLTCMPSEPRGTDLDPPYGPGEITSGPGGCVSELWLSIGGHKRDGQGMGVHCIGWSDRAMIVPTGVQLDFEMIPGGDGSMKMRFEVYLYGGVILEGDNIAGGGTIRKSVVIP